MASPFPTQPGPDPELLARAQARLIAAVSQFGATAPSGSADAVPSGSTDAVKSQQISWLGLQGDWEARHEEEPTGERYRFGEVFARGGLGSVRWAVDRKLGRRIAVKELLRFDDRAVRRFVREAAIMARLQHPGIVPLYDLGRDAAGRPFLCMKLVDGSSLEQRIAQCGDALDARVKLLRHVVTAAEALAYAHRQAIVHRDVKPANILIGELGEAVVIDWGLAKDLSPGSSDDNLAGDDPGTASDMTEAGSLLGTLRYMPPEQARGEPVDARSDVYALGATLYHLLAGVPPFHDRRSAQLMHDVVRAQPRPLAELAPQVPAALVAVVEKAMSQTPDRRYPSAEALADDLRRFAAGQAVVAHDYSLGELTRLWWRRHRAVATVGLAAAVILAGVNAMSQVRVRQARDVAEERRMEAELRATEAESARQLAAERAQALLMSQARLALDVDPTRVFGALAQVEPDPARDNAVRALATAAYAQLGLGGWMTGPKGRISDALRLADGTWLAATSEELWRWPSGQVHGERIGGGGILVATPDRTTWAAVRVVDGGETAIAVHRPGAPGPAQVAVKLDKPAVFYRWRMTPGGASLVGTPKLDVPAAQIDLSRGTAAPLPGPDAPAAVQGLKQVQPSPDGRMLAGVRDERTLVMWDRETGAIEAAELPGEAASLGTDGWTPDGRAFALLCLDREQGPGHARKAFVWRRGGPARVVDAEFVAPARDALVFIGMIAGSSTAWAEDLEGHNRWTRYVRRAMSSESSIVAIPTTSRDGDLVWWSVDQALEVVDVATGARVFAQAQTLREAPMIDAGTLLLRRAEGLARVEPAQASVRAVRPGSSDASADWSPNRAWVVRQEEGRVTRIGQATGEELLPEACGPWTPTRVVGAVADDGRALVVDGEGGGCFFGHGRSAMLDTPPHWLSDGAFAPDRSRSALGFADGTLREWTDPAAPPRELAGVDFHRFLDYTPDSSVLVALGSSGAVTAIDRAGTPRTLIPARPANPRRLERAALALAPEGATLALYRRGEPAVTLLDIGSGAQTKLAGAVAGEVAELGTVIRYSPSGQAVAVLDGEVLLRWSLDRPDAPERTGDVPGWDFAFLDERTLVVLGEDGGLEIVDPASGTHAPIYPGSVGREHPTLARTPGGVALRTRSGEELEFSDILPPSGPELRAWLRQRATL
ncbi:Serine/threonine protein kinase [Nannocystis exedens]|uniref:non-specific serine/threonine protein kinase n=1 Tax=Nannocystis exedens TaxID=54 RepID=A0A1I2DZQ3_9BACT|nr:serine/threonine-protein kinase [Nannocystis exedens]PCC69175.1 Serine/threonine-protein kinase PknB [Nannocystis exedens]SFE85906.1 Serine/threonine protein kinase [Nannocystis exedens]